MRTKYSLIPIAVLLIICFHYRAVAQADKLPAYFNGITLDAAQLLTADEEDLTDEEKEYRKRTKTALEHLPTATIVRVVFDADTKPGDYSAALDYLRSLKLPNGDRKIFIMGELLDSDFLARYRWDCGGVAGCTADENSGSAFHDYKTRIDSYVSTLDGRVDIWEVGNEVNGEWADEGCIRKLKKNGEDDGCFSDVKREEDGKGNVNQSTPRPEITAQKIAYAVKAVKNRPIALTVMHQPECTTWDTYTMSGWMKASKLKSLIDGYKINYLLISYYEDNCDKGGKTIAPESELKKVFTKEQLKRMSDAEKKQRRRDIYWTATFNELEKYFSNVGHVGFGEVGYSSDMKTCPKDVMSFCKDGETKPVDSKLTLLNRYYGMTVNNPKYIGGHFWWTAQEDITYSGFSTVLKDYFNRHN